MLLAFSLSSQLVLHRILNDKAANSPRADPVLLVRHLSHRTVKAADAGEGGAVAYRAPELLADKRGKIYVASKENGCLSANLSVVRCTDAIEWKYDGRNLRLYVENWDSGELWCLAMKSKDFRAEQGVQLEKCIGFSPAFRQMWFMNHEIAKVSLLSYCLTVDQDRNRVFLSKCEQILDNQMREEQRIGFENAVVQLKWDFSNPFKVKMDGNFCIGINGTEDATWLGKNLILVPCEQGLVFKHDIIPKENQAQFPVAQNSPDEDPLCMATEFLQPEIHIDKNVNIVLGKCSDVKQDSRQQWLLQKKMYHVTSTQCLSISSGPGLYQRLLTYDCIAHPNQLISIVRQ